MGDRLERTDVWQSHHDRVTGEIPVVVSDEERLDMFPEAYRFGLDARFHSDRMFDDATAAPTPKGCVLCGRSSRIAGNEETIMFRGPEMGDFVHAVCDDRWDDL